MNAAVLASGLAVGGRGGARNALADFWYSVVYLASLGPLQPTFQAIEIGGHMGNPAIFP
jgi:NTE family protein